ncbi:hypothetical protein N7527_005579 [Penicillium freii]|uniref:Uncharacterized protein n=1 Tax=Penicillium freii TaxID=48697 RepID=A0A101M8P4_PENFR|nr:hypothetical protein N7527_005579 [Penicillium freii]KUM56034.1 hypothetical protein ACN42_g11192 [Penicillium freii]
MEVPNKLNQFYAFYGGQYFQAKIDSSSSDSFVYSAPKSIASGWPGLVEAGFDRVDAILKKAETDYIYYVFRGNQFVRIYWKSGNATINRYTDLIKEEWKYLSL